MKSRLFSLAAGLLIMLLATTGAMAQQRKEYKHYTVDSGTAGVASTPAMLFDDDTSTKWCVTHLGNPTYVEFQSYAPITPVGYKLATGDDTSKYPGRNPQSWTIKAKANADDEWTTLQEVTDDESLQDVDQTFYSFDFSSLRGPYQYFRLEVNSVESGTEFQLSEFRFIAQYYADDLSMGEILGIQDQYIYTGEDIEVPYSVQSAVGVDLTEGTDFETTLTFEGAEVQTVKALGEYKLAVTGKGDYHGTTYKYFSVTDGTGIGSPVTSQDYYPFVSGYNFTLSQQIYTADEFDPQAKGNYIIDFSLLCNAGRSKDTTIDVYMVNTDKANFKASQSTNACKDWVQVSANDLVFSGTVEFKGGKWTKFNLQKPFRYDGRNLLLVIYSRVANRLASSEHYFASYYATNQTVGISGNSAIPDPTIIDKNTQGAVFSSKCHLLMTIRDLDNFTLAEDDRNEVESEQNQARIDRMTGLNANVILDGRTLVRSGSWNTLCLPFDLSDFSGTPLEGASLKKLSSSSFADGVLTLNFTTATAIEAGKPYLVRWESPRENSQDPLFQGMKVKSVVPEDYDVATDVISMKGVFSPVVFETGTPRKDILFIGGDGMLHYPDGTTDTNINAFRSYFQLAEGYEAGEPAEGASGVKAFRLNFDDSAATDIVLTTDSNTDDTAAEWYDLAGRRLSHKPSAPGIYIHDGKKVFVR